MCILTPYRAALEDIVSVDEGMADLVLVGCQEASLYSTARYHMYILTPYRTVLEDIISVDEDMADFVVVGCPKTSCILLNGTICMF